MKAKAVFSDNFDLHSPDSSAQALMLGQRRVLSMLGTRAPLDEILSALVYLIEEYTEGSLCSVLVIGNDTRTLKSIAHYRLPAAYVDVLNGASILPPYLGPCGYAAHRGVSVVVDDIEKDLRWSKAWRDLAISFQLKTCRSTPIFSSDGRTLGTLAIYNVPPDAAAIEYQAETAAHIAGIAIERKAIEYEQNSRRERLEELNKKLEEGLKMRDEFLSVASHELMTPLTALKLKNQLRSLTLERKFRPEIERDEVLRMLKEDERQYDRVIRVVCQMLDISRLTSGKYFLEKENFNLSDLIREVVDRHLPELEVMDCKLNVEIPDSICGFWDRFKLDQLLTNLLTNAMKYGSGKPISLSAEAKGAEVVISITDQGVGISPDDQNRIFEKFERVNSPTKVKGLGLGLFIAKQIVEAHHGSIELESRLGEGAIFKVGLPLH